MASQSEWMPGRADSFIVDVHRNDLLRHIAGDVSVPEATAMLGDRFRLLRKIGRGGMGTVWEAEHVGLGKRVAVKRMRREFAHDARLRRRFLREARAAAAVKHPHVVDILDVASDDDGPYLVMELLDGRSLAEQLRREGPMPWSRAARILVQLASALDHAHGQGVVHRDLKPGNIIVCNAGAPDESVKIIDFGLAKQYTLSRALPDTTRAGEIFGSFGYMSPEQLRGTSVDARTDLYALGCIAFEMLTGRKPFPGPTFADLIVQQLTRDTPRVSPLVREATRVPSASIDALIRRALRTDPDERHPSAAAFVADVERICAGRVSFFRPWTGAIRWPQALALVVVVFVSPGTAFTIDGDESSDEASDRVEHRRPIERATPPWPSQWIGTTLGFAEPWHDSEIPDRTGMATPEGTVGLWAVDPRTGDPRGTTYRLILDRADAMAVSRAAVEQGLTLGHAADPARVELHGRGGDPATGRVYWTDATAFPWRAIGTTHTDRGCAGVQIGPVHVLTAAACVWKQGGYALADRSWRSGSDRPDQPGNAFVRIYVPQQWPQNDRAGLFDWAVAITEHPIGETHFGVTALSDASLFAAPLWHKGFPREHDRNCDAYDPSPWVAGVQGPWGNAEPLRVGPRNLRAADPVSGWGRLLATAAITSTGHKGGPYYVYDASDRPVVVAMHRSGCTGSDGSTPEFCGFTAPWSCETKAGWPSQAIRLEPENLYAHIVPVLTWWGVDESGRAVCLLEGGC